jgi:uncharacterized membrane protein (UPF0127 family)
MLVDAHPAAQPDALVAVDAAAPPVADAALPDAAVPTRVILSPQPGAEHAVNVQIARTPAERARGLMYVQNLPMDDGMIFIFTEDDDHSFWMKNTLIYLDMIFISSDLEVVGVVENAEPLTLGPRGVGKLSRYVLEVNGGWSAAQKVAAGTKVRFEGFEP